MTAEICETIRNFLFVGLF